MAKHYTCDRCGEPVTSNWRDPNKQLWNHQWWDHLEFSEGLITVSINKMIEKADLCLDCIWDFVEWWRKGHGQNNSN